MARGASPRNIVPTYSSLYTFIDLFRWSMTENSITITVAPENGRPIKNQGALRYARRTSLHWQHIGVDRHWWISQVATALLTEASAGLLWPQENQRQEERQSARRQGTRCWYLHDDNNDNCQWRRLTPAYWTNQREWQNIDCKRWW